MWTIYITPSPWEWLPPSIFRVVETHRSTRTPPRRAPAAVRALLSPPIKAGALGVLVGPGALAAASHVRVHAHSPQVRLPLPSQLLVVDELLRQFAERLRGVFRASDHLVRWGGEEFLVVARDTPRGRAAELAERVRDAIAGAPFIHNGQALPITASIGWAPLPWDAASPQALGWEAVVALADLALYTVKQGGRNGWLGLLPNVPLPPEADLAWLMKRMPRMLTSGELRLASNLNTDRLAHLIASQAR